jgi:uncharacterized membrane protein
VTDRIVWSPTREKRALNLSPATAFLTLSLIFGSVVILVTPPLRGPDETAHFLRAYGVAQGDVVPSLRDGESRKGILLSPRLYAGFDFFESARVKEKEAGFSYRAVVEAYLANPAATIAASASRFVPYAGSEGYSPIAYLPQAAAALLARALDLTFLPTLYLMRFAGLLVLTSVIACAIAIVPGFRWAFVAIAMLPAAFYGRSVINADGSALAAAMMVTALWLRAAICPKRPAPGWQSLWMVLNALTKAPNVTFVLLELPLLTRRNWWRLALVVLPAVAAAAAWTFSSGADTAAWRMVEITGRAPDAFDPSAKLSHMIEHPLRFPLAVLGALDAKSAAELWRQTIGVLGLFDTVLLGWIYPVISVLALASFFTPLPLATSDRLQIAASAAITAIAYIAVVYLISYLVFTPSDVNSVWGVQGRYFIPILSLVAIALGALAGRGLDERVTAALAIASSVVSGCASVEAILRTDWFAS